MNISKQAAEILRSATKEINVIRETLHMSDYQLYAETKSRIDPSKTFRTEAGFGCPHCHEVIKKPVTINHGHTYVHTCGLKMTVYGNALECELDESRTNKR